MITKKKVVYGIISLFLLAVIAVTSLLIYQNKKDNNLNFEHEDPLFTSKFMYQDFGSEIFLNTQNFEGYYRRGFKKSDNYYYSRGSATVIGSRIFKIDKTGNINGYLNDKTKCHIEDYDIINIGLILLCQEENSVEVKIYNDQSNTIETISTYPLESKDNPYYFDTYTANVSSNNETAYILDYRGVTGINLDSKEEELVVETKDLGYIPTLGGHDHPSMYIAGNRLWFFQYEDLRYFDLKNKQMHILVHKDEVTEEEFGVEDLSFADLNDAGKAIYINNGKLNIGWVHLVWHSEYYTEYKYDIYLATFEEEEDKWTYVKSSGDQENKTDKLNELIKLNKSLYIEDTEEEYSKTNFKIYDEGKEITVKKMYTSLTGDEELDNKIFKHWELSNDCKIMIYLKATLGTDPKLGWKVYHDDSGYAPAEVKECEDTDDIEQNLKIALDELLTYTSRRTEDNGYLHNYALGLDGDPKFEVTNSEGDFIINLNDYTYMSAGDLDISYFKEQLKLTIELYLGEGDYEITLDGKGGDVYKSWGCNCGG
jgi:hypothetical protein